MSADETSISQCETTKLGRAGVTVPRVMLGTMTFSLAGTNAMGMPVTDDAASCAMMNYAKERNVYFLDTADAYSSGESETVIGRWLAAEEAKHPGFRSQVMLATKCFFPTGSGPNDKGLSRAHVLDAVRASLGRLQTEYIDVLILHCWDYETPIEETLSAIHDLTVAGSIRYFGVSNFSGAQLAETVAVCQAKGYAIPVVAQHQYSLLVRAIEWDILPVCRKHSIAVMAWSPLASGWLTGRYTRESEAPQEGSRIAWNDNISFTGLDWETCANARTWDIVDTLADIAEAHEVTPAQVALRWLVQRSTPGCPIIPIIGAKKQTHLEDNLGVITLELSDEEVARLSEVSKTPLPYPFNFLQAMGGDFA